jgi:hypothetical protein
MLFYESAKCLHGRRSQLKGKYYGSIFVHYQPVDPKIWNYSVAVRGSVLHGPVCVVALCCSCLVVHAVEVIVQFALGVGDRRVGSALSVFVQG